MADNVEASDPFGDFVRLVAGPVAAGVRSVEQMRHATDEFVRGVENFNRTMENLNATVERVNRLLDDVEAPIRALVPQVTRTVEAVDDLTQRFSDLPIDPAELVHAIVELSRRLGPLAQMAESATGMFGLRLPGFGGGAATSGSSANPAPSPPDASAGDQAAQESPAKKPAAKRSTATASPSKRAAAKRSTAKKSPATKSSAKKSSAKRSS